MTAGEQIARQLLGEPEPTTAPKAAVAAEDGPRRVPRIETGHRTAIPADEASDKSPGQQISEQLFYGQVLRW
ncbi:MAG: hypothetical protein ACRDRL_22540 [Sciscionella sp.]